MRGEQVHAATAHKHPPLSPLRTLAEDYRCPLALSCPEPIAMQLRHQRTTLGTTLGPHRCNICMLQGTDRL